MKGFGNREKKLKKNMKNKTQEVFMGETEFSLTPRLPLNPP